MKWNYITIYKYKINDTKGKGYEKYFNFGRNCCYDTQLYGGSSS